MKFLVTHLMLFLVLSFSVYSQSVAVNTDGSVPDSSAILDIQSSSKGILVPRMGFFQRAFMVKPATGLLVYQTDQNTASNPPGFYYNAGTPQQPNWRHMSTDRQRQFLQSNGSFVVPQGVTKVYFEAVGGGGGRGGRTSKEVATGIYYYGGTGGGGAFAKGFINVLPGQTVNIVVGLPGASGTDGAVTTDGVAGGNTTISIGALEVLNAGGGSPGLKATIPSVGTGGMGGVLTINPVYVVSDIGLWGIAGNDGRTTTNVDNAMLGVSGYTPLLGEINYLTPQTVSFTMGTYSFYTCPALGKGGGVTQAQGGYVLVYY